MFKKNDIVQYMDLSGRMTMGCVERVLEKTCMLWSVIDEHKGKYALGMGSTEVRFELLKKIGETG